MLRRFVLFTAFACLSMLPEGELRAAEPVLAQAQMPQRGAGGGQGRGPGGGRGMQQERMLPMLDADGDGQLSREEFVEGERPGMMSGSGRAVRNREQMFDQLDQDGDGRLSGAEMPRARP